MTTEHTRDTNIADVEDAEETEVQDGDDVAADVPTVQEDAPSSARKQRAQLALRHEVFALINSHACDIVMWKDPVRSGIALASSLASVMFLTCFMSSLLKCSLALFVFSTVTTTSVVAALRLFQSITKTDHYNPLLAFVPMATLVVAQEDALYYAEVAVTVVNCFVQKLAKIVMVESLSTSAASAAIGYTLWKLSKYVPTSALLVTVTLGVFSLPLAYRHNKEFIHKQIAVVEGIACKQCQCAMKHIEPYLQKGRATLSGNNKSAVSSGTGNTTAHKKSASASTKNKKKE